MTCFERHWKFRFKDGHYSRFQVTTTRVGLCFSRQIFFKTGPVASSEIQIRKMQNWFELCAWINHFTLTAWAFGQSWKFMPWSQKLAVLKAFLPHRTFYWENFWTMIVDIICLEISFGFIKIILTCISFELERNAFLCRERRRCTISWLHALTMWRHSYYLGYSHKLAVVTKFGFLWLPIVEKNVRTP